MDASETFTCNGSICWRDWDNNTQNYGGRVNMRVSSWGVHAMQSNKDYYYLKQNVTLKMGKIGGSQIYWPTDSERWWWGATNYGSYDRWFGSFLSKYETSMNLAGSGSINLEAAAPNTDNNSSSTSVTIGTSHSTTETAGISWSGGGSASGAMGSIGGSYSYGTTDGSSFSMGMSQTNKDLGIKKNTTGTKVTWTYTGTLPQYYCEETKDKYLLKHQTPAAILVNDCDVANEICWSVDNPSGRYTVNITSAPQTAALLYSYSTGSKGDFPHKHEYTDTPAATYPHELLEPNRAMQIWRMNLTIDEWEGQPIIGTLSELETAIRNAFPDIYANVFKVADKTPTSLNSIAYIVNYSKQIFSQRADILKSYAKSYGIQKFTIHWTCDHLNVKTREGFAVRVTDATFTATDGTQHSNSKGYTYKNLFDHNSGTIWFTNHKRNGVYFVEFQSSRSITPTAYTLTVGTYLITYPKARPKSWKLMAKKNEGDEWAVISTVTADTKLTDKIGSSAKYDLDVTGEKWQYFRLEISATQGDSYLNLGDFDFEY